MLDKIDNQVHTVMTCDSSIRKVSRVKPVSGARATGLVEHDRFLGIRIELSEHYGTPHIIILVRCSI